MKNYLVKESVNSNDGVEILADSPKDCIEKYILNNNLHKKAVFVCRRKEGVALNKIPEIANICVEYKCSSKDIYKLTFWQLV